MKYARDVFRAVRRYKQTCRSVECYPEFQEYFVHYPIKHSQLFEPRLRAADGGPNQEVLDIGCGEGISGGGTEEERQPRHRRRHPAGGA